MRRSGPYLSDDSPYVPLLRNSESGATVPTRHRDSTIRRHDSSSEDTLLSLLGFVLVSITILMFILVLTIFVADANFKRPLFGALNLLFTAVVGTTIWLMVGFVVYCAMDLGNEPWVSCVPPLLSAMLVGIILKLIYQNLPPSMMWSLFYTPHPYQGCDARVDPQQASLFTPDIYLSQFRYIPDQVHGARNFNATIFGNLRNNETLCGKGFQGNSDLYGLGIRIGIYTQWFASLCSNHILPGNGEELQKVYLIFSLAICVTTLVSTFRMTCIFSIEIEILYWMFWGGSICVFVSAPSTARLGTRQNSTGLSWTFVLQFLTHLIMIHHSVWFIWYAYNHIFVKMPCGTYQFFLAQSLDPGWTFWSVSSTLTTLLCPLLFLLALTVPLVAVIFAAEAVQSLKQGVLFQSGFSWSGGYLTTANNRLRDVQGQYGHSLPRPHHLPERTYRRLRNSIGLPSHAQQEIRLMTPRAFKYQRTYRIYCAILGFTSWVLTMSAIEFTLKWNNITDVNSLMSIGQYMPLTIGVASLISTLWRLLTKDAKRRRQETSYQTMDDELEETELQSTRPNPDPLLSTASRAFQQADSGFLTRRGAHSPSSRGSLNGERPIASSSGRSSMDFLDPANDYVMSGAIGPVQSGSDLAPPLASMNTTADTDSDITMAFG